MKTVTNKEHNGLFEQTTDSCQVKQNGQQTNTRSMAQVELVN